MENNKPHLVTARQEPTRPRRRAGGGTSPTKVEDVQAHADTIQSELSAAGETLEQKKPAEFDPGLMLKLEVQPDTLGEQQLRSFGIELVSEEDDHLLVVFVDSEAKEKFVSRLRRFRAGESGRGVNSGVFHALEKIAEWSRTDRIGRTLADQPWGPTDSLVVDVEFWPRETVAASRKVLDQSVAWLENHGAEVWVKWLPEASSLRDASSRERFSTPCLKSIP